MSLVNIHYCVRGKFDVDIIRSCGRVDRVLTGVPNIITNTGLDAIGTSTNFAGVLAVGSGSSPPSATDTALAAMVAQVAGVNFSNTPVQDVPNRTTTYSAVATFAVGAAAGNLVELGIGRSATSLSTRALFRDSAGDPTTVIVGPQDQLVVTYYIVFKWPEPTVMQVTDPKTGIVYDITSSAGAVGSGPSGLSNAAINVLHDNAGWAYTGSGVVLGGPLVDPSGGSRVSATYARTTKPYATGDYRREDEVVLGLTSGSAGVLTAVHAFTSSVSSVCVAWKLGFSPAWSKTAQQTVTIGYVLSWSRG